MPQGKLKVKTKLPSGVKTKKKNVKGSAVTKRQNRPVPPKKAKMVEVQKVKKAMSKNINMVAEEDLRQKALEGRQSLKRSAPSSAPSGAHEDGPSKKKRKN